MLILSKVNILIIAYCSFPGTVEVSVPTGDGGPASSAGLDGYGLFMTFDTNGNMFSSSAFSSNIRLTRSNTQIISAIAGI